jgi:prepilin-type N-terminal cleavage/methylation domain-containing protein/prepilin-type processing-associated H-X9-DG protein
MNRARKTAFTLVELLVVIGIIAVLIAILLPALSRARDQAYTIQCQSNLRQLHTAFVLYSAMFKDYCIPAEASNSTLDPTSSGTDNWWCGVNTLGKALGVKDANKQNVLDRIAKMVKCPANDRSKDLTVSNFTYCYTYNSNLGDIRGMPGPQKLDNYVAAHAFKKWTQVPGNVIELAESGLPLVKDDERFDTLDELTWKKAYGGQPHRKNTKGNVLFHDGSVYLCRVYTVDAMALGGVRTQAAPTFTDFDTCNKAFKKFTDLQCWMVAHPGHASTTPVTSVNQQKDYQCWKKGLPLPNFGN